MFFKGKFLELFNFTGNYLLNLRPCLKTNTFLKQWVSLSSLVLISPGTFSAGLKLLLLHAWFDRDETCLECRSISLIMTLAISAHKIRLGYLDICYVFSAERLSIQ